MRKTIILKAIALLLVISSCSDDEGQDLIDFTVNFNSETVSTTEKDTSVDVQLNFSRPASEAGTISIAYTGTNAEYGTDFTTTPNGESGTIAVVVAKGDQSASFTFNKLSNAIEGSTKSVTFSIGSFDQTDWKQGAKASALVSFTPIASTNGIIDSENGGSNIPNQVYFDFSSATQTAVRRDTWEIAFYNGTEFISHTTRVCYRTNRLINHRSDILEGQGKDLTVQQFTTKAAQCVGSGAGKQPVA